MQTQTLAPMKFVGVRMPEADFAKLAAHSESHDRSVSASVRRAVRLLLAAEGS